MSSSPQLLSVAILFRHGARGPGDSELNAFDKSGPITTQWKEHDLENLSTRGMEQIAELGRWFAQTYTASSTTTTASSPEANSTAGKKKLRERIAPFFRGSIADRAVDSGRDFVSSFNQTIGYSCCELDPAPYIDHPDTYFRPWKVNKEIGQVIKHKMCQSDWAQLVDANDGFLSRIGRQLEMKSDISSHSDKILLSSTHIAGLMECELYWPRSQGIRSELCSRLCHEEDREKIHHLACYVWQERYLRTGMERELGGKIFLDMIQALFDPEHNVNIFAGHDYTILVLLAAAGLLTELTQAFCFGSYVIFELWDSQPDSVASPDLSVLGLMPRISPGSVAESSSLGAEIFQRKPPSPSALSSGGFIIGKSSVTNSRPQSPRSLSSSNSRRILRVLINRQPFNADGGTSPVTSAPVCSEREEILCDLSMTAVAAIVNEVVVTLSGSDHLPPHWAMPAFL